MPVQKEVDNEEVFEVETILQHQLDKKVCATFLVKWRGFGPEHNSWEPLVGLSGAPDGLCRYFKSKGLPSVPDHMIKFLHPNVTVENVKTCMEAYSGVDPQELEALHLRQLPNHHISSQMVITHREMHERIKKLLTKHNESLNVQAAKYFKDERRDYVKITNVFDLFAPFDFNGNTEWSMGALDVTSELPRLCSDLCNPYAKLSELLKNPYLTVVVKNEHDLKSGMKRAFKLFRTECPNRWCVTCESLIYEDELIMEMGGEVIDIHEAKSRYPDPTSTKLDPSLLLMISVTMNSTVSPIFFDMHRKRGLGSFIERTDVGSKVNVVKRFVHVTGNNGFVTPKLMLFAKCNIQPGKPLYLAEKEKMVKVPASLDPDKRGAK